MDIDVVMKTPADTVDMKSGLTTLQGVSDGTRCVYETVLTEKVPEKKSAKSKVRTSLKQRFRGSYGQTFGIDIDDDLLMVRAQKIGDEVFSELIRYYFNAAIYVRVKDLSEEAKEIIKSLGDTSDELVERLQINAIRNIHSVPKNFGFDVEIKVARKAADEPILIKFDEETASTLDLIKGKEIEITATITRLNRNTGNGRLQIEGAYETIAFGFNMKYESVSLVGKRKFSTNLDQNNGQPPEKLKYLKIKASPLRLRNGRVVKYIIEGNSD